MATPHTDDRPTSPGVKIETPQPDPLMAQIDDCEEGVAQLRRRFGVEEPKTGRVDTPWQERRH